MKEVLNYHFHLFTMKKSHIERLTSSTYSLSHSQKLLVTSGMKFNFVSPYIILLFPAFNWTLIIYRDVFSASWNNYMLIGLRIQLLTCKIIGCQEWWRDFGYLADLANIQSWKLLKLVFMILFGCKKLYIIIPPLFVFLL